MLEDVGECGWSKIVSLMGVSCWDGLGSELEVWEVVAYVKPGDGEIARDPAPATTRDVPGFARVTLMVKNVWSKMFEASKLNAPIYSVRYVLRCVKVHIVQ